MNIHNSDNTDHTVQNTDENWSKLLNFCQNVLVKADIIRHCLIETVARVSCWRVIKVVHSLGGVKSGIIILVFSSKMNPRNVYLRGQYWKTFL